MFEKWFHKIANKKGYFKLSQLEVGGMCGCCGIKIPDLIWVNYQDGNNWSDIGVCKTCREDGDDIIYHLVYGDGTNYILTKKKQSDFLAKIGDIMFNKNKEKGD